MMIFSYSIPWWFVQARNLWASTRWPKLPKFCTLHKMHFFVFLFLKCYMPLNIWMLLIMIIVLMVFSIYLFCSRFFGLSMHIQSPLFTSLLSCLLLNCASAMTLFCLSNFTIKVVDFFDKFSLDKPSMYTRDVPVGFDLFHALTKKFQW